MLLSTQLGPATLNPTRKVNFWLTNNLGDLTVFPYQSGVQELGNSRIVLEYSVFSF